MKATGKEWDLPGDLQQILFNCLIFIIFGFQLNPSLRKEMNYNCFGEVHIDKEDSAMLFQIIL